VSVSVSLSEPASPVPVLLETFSLMSTAVMLPASVPINTLVPAAATVATRTSADATARTTRPMRRRPGVGLTGSSQVGSDMVSRWGMAIGEDAPGWAEVPFEAPTVNFASFVAGGVGVMDEVWDCEEELVLPHPRGESLWPGSDVSA
jgi:hypothetical protein